MELQNKRRRAAEGRATRFLREVINGYNGSTSRLSLKQKLLLKSANAAERTVRLAVSPILEPVSAHFEAVALARRRRKRQKLNMLLIFLGIALIVVFFVAHDLNIF
jgi:hypothetical protein